MENPLADEVKKAYESDRFKLDDYNAALSKDAKELRMAEKKTWPELNMEQKFTIGLVYYDKHLISLKLEGS